MDSPSTPGDPHSRRSSISSFPSFAHYPINTMPEGFRFRRGTGTSRPAEDEWYIPYSAPTSPKPPASYSIGQSPAPPRSQNTNILSYFSGPAPSGPLGEPGNGFQFPPLPPTPKSTVTSHHFAPAERFPSGLRKVPSQGSLLESSSMRSRIPTTNSVPTGLSAPKLLFSPLSREVRGTTFIPGSAVPSPPVYDQPRQPRQRTVSAPQRRSRRNTFDDHPPSRRWDAPTVCDKLVFARPSITPHYITPPGSPEDDNDNESDVFSALASRVMADGKKREEERDQWANYTRFRRRTRSFGNEPPREDAPVIGNARAREKDIERRMSGSRKRSSSLTRWIPRHGATRSMGDLLARPELEQSDSDRSVGVGRSFTFTKRNSNSTGQGSRSTSADQSPMFGDATDPFKRLDAQKRPFPSAKGGPIAYTPGHGYTRSSPELLQRTARRSAPGPPPRSLRVSNPPVRRSGVVIITAEDESQRSPTKGSSLDFSKPLPPLPSDASPRVEIEPFDSLTSEIGKAISPPKRVDPPTLHPQPEVVGPVLTGVQPSPAHARTYLAQQHLKNRTKKAFQSPSSSRHSTRSRATDPPTPTPMGKQPLRASTSTTSSVSTVSPRRPTALEEAIGRSRAATLSAVDQGGPSMPLATPPKNRPQTVVEDDYGDLPRILATKPSFSPNTSLAYPIRTGSPAGGLAIPPPLGSRNNSNFSTTSKGTVFTDASEGWGRSGTSTPADDRPRIEDTPSPEDEMTDKFKGLFYRTPQDMSTPFVPSKRSPHSAARSTFPSLSSENGTPTGLGFGLEQQQASARDPRRQSYASGGTSDGTDTVELATPVFSPDTQAQQNAYLRYVEQHAGDEEVQGYDVPEGPLERSRSIRTARRTLSQRSSNNPEFRLAPAPVRRPTLIATPPQLTNPGRADALDGHHRLRSFTVIPTDYSPESSDSTDPNTSTGTLLPANPNASNGSVVVISTPNSQPAFSPGTFGAGVEEVPNPLEVPIVFTPEIAQEQQSPAVPTSPDSVYSSLRWRRESAATGAGSRYSAVPSFVQDFPSPPAEGETQDSESRIAPTIIDFASSPVDENGPILHTMTTADAQDQSHESAFGQIVTGPPGAGKTTYCHGMHQFLTALGRRPIIVNLDPAVPNPPYPCAINITEILTLEEVMSTYELGPNGAMIYVMEHLEENMDWLVGRLDEVLRGEQADGPVEEDGEGGSGGDGGGDGQGAYVIFDTPGQVELWTNHESLKRVITKLNKMDYRLVAVHLSDAHYITDASKFISVTLLALRAMAQLELPHVNVLSKIDLLASYGDLPFDLRYYAEARDLDYLLDALESEPGRSGHANEKMAKLNRAMVELLDDYGNVSFETLAVEDKRSMLKLLRTIDKSNGYIHLPGQTLPENYIDLDTLPDIEDLPDVDDVQERWGANRAVHDAVEEEEWQREWAVRGGRALGPAAEVVRMPEGAVRER